MEHKPYDALQAVADIHDGEPRFLSRWERLERWADVLDREPRKRLRSLEEIDLAPKAERPLLRANNSPLTVAFADPVLRAEGLGSDRLGEAMRFFDMSEYEAHRLLCSCLNGGTMEAGRTAQRIRAMARRTGPALSTAWLVAAGALAVPGLIYLLA